MPKSKRARVVHTSQVQKKPSKERSQALFASIHESLDKPYKHVFVFSVENMRNTYLKDIRQTLSDARLFFGKTKVMAKALGMTAEEEHAPGLRRLTRYLKGNVGLLCTDQDPTEISSFFEEFVQLDYARAGSAATETVTVPAGIVYSTGGRQPQEDDTAIPHSLETTLRKWGMPTRLDKGKVMLDAPYVVCKEGKVMDSNQTALLKLFGIATAEFRVRLVAYWTASTGNVTVLDESFGDAAPDMDLDDDSDE